MKNTKGVLLATAAAALFVSHPILAEDIHPAAEGKVKCWGINACTGTAECNTKADLNACKGKNKCKTAGWLSKTKEECEKEGGKVTE
ncbi:MAG: BufA2 family periplasmic bufferin-type metallophore [Gammaproteobacteria bacterium]